MIMRDYYKQIYANKKDNLEEVDKLLDKHNLPRLNQEKIENIKRPNIGKTLFGINHNKILFVPPSKERK